MATNFPASLDTLTNPTSSDSLSSPSHSAQHANANDAIEALQAKVGVDSSAVTSSLDYKVAQLEAQGTYTDYSGSITFNNFTLGNGTVNWAYYTRLGDFVHYVGQVTLGSTSAFTSSAISLSAPITPANRERGAGNAEYIDNGVGAYEGTAHPNGSVIQLYCLDETGGFVKGNNVNQNRPFVWTTGDTFSWTVVYRAA